LPIQQRQLASCLEIGDGLAEGPNYPEWKAGANFKAEREAMMMK
jgi:hypothetical protein